MSGRGERARDPLGRLGRLGRSRVLHERPDRREGGEDGDRPDGLAAVPLPVAPEHQRARDAAEEALDRMPVGVRDHPGDARDRRAREDVVSKLLVRDGAPPPARLLPDDAEDVGGPLVREVPHVLARQVHAVYLLERGEEGLQAAARLLLEAVPGEPVAGVQRPALPFGRLDHRRVVGRAPAVDRGLVVAASLLEVVGRERAGRAGCVRVERNLLAPAAPGPRRRPLRGGLARGRTRHGRRSRRRRRPARTADGRRRRRGSAPGGRRTSRTSSAGSTPWLLLQVESGERRRALRPLAFPGVRLPPPARPRSPARGAPRGRRRRGPWPRSPAHGSGRTPACIPGSRARAAVAPPAGRRRGRLVECLRRARPGASGSCPSRASGARIDSIASCGGSGSRSDRPQTAAQCTSSR